MICKNCRKEIINGIKFCNFCGEKVEDIITFTQRKHREIKVMIDKALVPKIMIGVVSILILYVIFAKNPFSFLSSNKEIDQKILISSVVNILCEDNHGGIISGSGTIITTDGTILTNSHIIPHDDEYILTPGTGCLVVLPNSTTGEPDEAYWANPVIIQELSDNYDLAYLEIYDVLIDEDDGKIYGYYPKIFPSIFAEQHKYDDICKFRTPKLGDPIRIFGYPQTSGGFYLTITDGVVSSFSEEGVILTSAKIDSGNSGGLAVDQNGCMIGVPVAITEGVYQNLGVIIPKDLILEFFERII